MATALVNDADIQAIRPTTVDTAVFIQTAAILQATYLGTAGLSTELLTEIQRYLTAHLMEMALPALVTQKSLADTKLTFGTADLGAGLKGTTYGQHVLLLDPTGSFVARAGLKQGRLQTFGV